MNRWTPEEIEYLKASYGKLPNPQIYTAIPNHTKNMIKLKANSFGLKSVRYWTPDDLEYLNESYGTTSDEQICKYLNRSKNALHIQCVRKLKINHKTNFYTAREVALLLGVACSKTIIKWLRNGWVTGKRSSVHCGGGFMWNFSYEAIEKCLHERPWIVDCAKMELSFFRSIIKEEYAKNPWFSISKTSKMLGVAYYSGAMAFYIKKKWLHPIKKPIEGGNHWTWIFFKDDIDRFLANDPRRLRPLQISNTRRRQNFKAGKAVRVFVIWKLKCPQCNKTVRIKCANSRLDAPAVKKLFIGKYNQAEACSHDGLCTVEKVLQPYKPRNNKQRR